jgi:hypothetical protein
LIATALEAQRCGSDPAPLNRGEWGLSLKSRDSSWRQRVRQTSMSMIS